MAYPMCELLALSTSQPVRLSLSLHTLASHGGTTGSTHDGWGVAFYQGKDVALFREPLAAADSALVRYLETQGPDTSLVISHIRHATRGTVQFSNTQPFIRELAGFTHAFAHNGDLPGIEESAILQRNSFRPAGETDSEHAFCVLLSRMRAIWEDTEVPSLEARLSLLATFAADVRLLGPANFLYADGDALFAHGHRRRPQAGGQAEPPGLWVLQRHCAPADPSTETHAGISVGQHERSAVFIASVPLTDEPWRPLSEGEVLAVRSGEVLESRLPAAI